MPVDTLAPTPLPSSPYGTGSPEHTAYQTCLWLETVTQWGPFIDNLADRSKYILQSQSPIVSARVLGYALIHAINYTGRTSLAREINNSIGNLEILAALAYLYIHGLIRVFKNPNGRTPLVSANQSPHEAFQAAVSGTTITSGATPQSLKDQLLYRERYFCALTIAVDRESLRKQLPELAHIDPSDDTVPKGNPQAAHITK